MQGLEKHYDGLVFDMDGTLADTMPAHYVAWSEAMERHGIRFTEERFYALGGVAAPVVVEIVAGEQGIEVDAHAVAEAKERSFIDSLDDVRPVEAVKAIAEAHLGLLPMAVATGSPKWAAERILGALGILDWFGVIVGSECVERPKPAPDVYLRAAEGIGVDPRRCHAFEDTRLGIEAARAAGMTVIDIGDLG